MTKFRNLVATGVFFAAASLSHASVITQEFDSNWTVSTWDYYGDVAALRWHYLPYLPWTSPIGTLTKVSISTKIIGEKNAPEDLAIRYAFFTGWSPNQYQFYDGRVFSAGDSSFSGTFEYDIPASNFAKPLFLSQANYYFESRSATTHSITARTTLTYNYLPSSEVPLPAPWSLLIAGSVAFTVYRRWARNSA